MSEELLSINEASKWATIYLKKFVSPSNISYLIQYANLKRVIDGEGKITINKEELKRYYDEYLLTKQEEWKAKLGKDLNWGLSFDYLKESDTTKHVHRLHPYKGKFIPQLVEYFLDGHINNFKKEVFFKERDIILDPFMGCGTTLVQASELGMHSIGVDISEFNVLISKVKTDDYNIFELNYVLKGALTKTIQYSQETFDDSYDEELKNRLSKFNKEYFPSFEFKHHIKEGRINEYEYGEENLNQFITSNNDLLSENGVKNKSNLFDEEDMTSFLSKWFTKRIKQELSFYLNLIEKMEQEQFKNVMRIILSRTARSCRATTHFDLATLKEPQIGPYYCRKHRKICTPVNSIIKHLRRYTYDTIKRLDVYSNLKKEVYACPLHGDSREINIFDEIRKISPSFYEILQAKKIAGIFTSPPYVGQIDYHEQHAYSYELFGIPRLDEKEIGPLSKGLGKKAKEKYVEEISKVLLNISDFIVDGGNFFIVANDKHDLYPIIAQKSDLKIINQFKRPVLNRTERDRQPYAEIIFQMKKDI